MLQQNKNKEVNATMEDGRKRSIMGNEAEQATDMNTICVTTDAATAGAGANDGTTFEGQQDEKTIREISHHSSSEDTTVGPTQDGLVPGESAVAPPPPSPEDSRTTLQTFIIMASLCTAVFLAALDTTIITTALPTISEYFHSDAGYTWIGSAYLLANAASTPSWGKFSDIWGRKPVLLVANIIFWIGSLLAGVSVNIGMLITARAIQGIGGGGLIVLSNICISDLFSMRNRGKYFGIIGMVWALASAVGPVLGGVFTEKVSWRWCFYINLPITGCAFFILLFFLHLDNPRTPVWDGLKAVDWIGSLAIVGGTLMLLLGLEFGGVTYPWNSATTICLIVFGIVTAGLFIVWESYGARYPVMPLHLFKDWSAVAALGVCFCHGYVFIAGSYYLPLYFQAVLGATPLLSGVYLLPFALALSFTSGATGVFVKKTGLYLPAIIFGLTLTTLGFGLFIDLDVDANWAKIILFQIVAGIGVGPNFQSPLIALQSRVNPRDIATATATFGFIRNLSTSISVVIGGVVFQNQMLKQTAALAQTLGTALANELSGGSAGASVGIVQSLPASQRVVVQYAYWKSLRVMWIMYVAFAALGLCISFFIKTTKLSKVHELTKTGLAEEESKRKERQEAKRASREMLRVSKEVNRSPVSVEQKGDDAV